MFRVHLIASSNHLDLQVQFNTWLRFERPERIHSVRFVADGSEFTYCVLVLFVPAKKID